MSNAANAPQLRRVNPIDGCWNRIGVQGDRSCSQLAAFGHCHNCDVFAASGQKLFERSAPPEYLDEWTRQVAEPEEAAAQEAVSLLEFRIADEWLALPARVTVEVTEPHAIHRVPHRSDRLLQGIVNIRGELELCVSLRSLLGIEGEASISGDAQPRMIVVELTAGRWVFPVDEVEGVHRASAHALQGLPHTVERSPRYFSRALWLRGERQVGVLCESRLSEALEKIAR